MTDFEKTKSLFDSMGIKYKSENHDSIKEWKHIGGDEYDHLDDFNFNQIITIDQGIGYEHFHSVFFFLNGKFVFHGIWE